MIRRYVFKLYPTADQAAELHDQRMMMVDLWNALKQRCEDVYRREHKMLSYFTLTKEITTLRRECPEWRAVPAMTCYRVAKLLSLAYQAFFRRVKAGGEAPGYPRWRRRVDGESIPLGTMRKAGWRITQREDNPLSWRLHYGSVTRPAGRAGGPATNYREVDDASADCIHARGRFPAALISWRNADIIWRDSRWWLSVCVDIAARRGRPAAEAGVKPDLSPPIEGPVEVRFNLIDSFADIRHAGQRESSGVREWARPIGKSEHTLGRAPASREAGAAIAHELGIAEARQYHIDELKSERDRRWPRSRRRDESEQREFEAATAEIKRLFAKVARIRRNALHVWSARIVAGMTADIRVIMPRVRERTRTARGTEKAWGANVEPVAEINRHVLAQAPATAAQMLKYKSEEAGIRCEIVIDDTPEIAVAGDLAVAGRELRRARRILRREAA